MTPRRLSLLILGNLAIFIALLLMIEGALGYALAAHHALTVEQVLATRRYITHDDTLGWVGRPGVTLENFYGPGRHLTTDARGNRLSHPPIADPTRVRVACGGDSFTFGPGVGDADTWCSQLTALNNGLRTTNKAVIGYGFDQMYLAYKNAEASDTDVHVLAFITDDFARMDGTLYLENPKPALSLRNDRLIVEGVPVPHHSGAVARFLTGVRGRLRTTTLLDRFRDEPAAPRALDGPEDDDPRLQPVVDEVLQDLVHLAAERKQALVLVYLPIEVELRNPELELRWQTYLRVRTAALGLPFLDLHETFVAAGAPAIRELFIPEDQDIAGDGSEGGHYTAEGHRIVAEAVEARIRAVIGPRRQTP